MASVVFFRAVNVGGHQKFQPSVLARQLADFDIVNVGAAGTFVVRENVAQARLREEILRRLQFKPELMICSAGDVCALVRCGPSHGKAVDAGVGQFVSVLQKALRVLPRLPLDQPAGGKWEVRIIDVVGKFVLSLRRPGRTGVYSNAVVEKHLGMPATTRGWNTIKSVCAILGERDLARG